MPRGGECGICRTSGRDGNQMTDTPWQRKGVGAVRTAGPVQFILGEKSDAGKVRKEQRRRVVLLFCFRA